MVVTASRATADLLETTLAAHGISAASTPYDYAYPSLDWVRGYRVVVPPDELERARGILAGLSGRDDVAPAPDEPPGTD